MTAPTLSISPSTVAKGEYITISWSGFEESYTIVLESVAGPGTISSNIGTGPDGSKTEQIVMDPSVWVLRLRQPTPEGDLVSNNVTLTIINGVSPPPSQGVDAPLVAGAALLVIDAILVGYYLFQTNLETLKYAGWPTFGGGMKLW